MNKKASCVLAFFLLFLCKLNAQIGNYPLGARSNSMSGITTTLSDVWSTNNNQAGLGFVKEITAGVYYENRFLLSETANKTSTFVYPTKAGALGFNITSFGFSAFTETKIGLSYGQRFGDKFSFGIQLNYLNTSLDQEYGSKNNVTGAAGFLVKLSEELTLGVHVYNPSRKRLADFEDERISTIMKLGMDYRFSKKVMLVIETEKDVDFDGLIKIGLEYHIIEILYLRAGVASNSVRSSFGFGLELKNFNVGFSSSYHQSLGLIPGISLIYMKSRSSQKKVNTTI